MTCQESWILTKLMAPETKTAGLASVVALVRELQQWVGLSQEKFAAKLGVIFSTVSRWERQKALPSPLAFDRMRKLLEKMGESSKVTVRERGQDLLAKYFPEDKLKLRMNAEVPKRGSS